MRQALLHVLRTDNRNIPARLQMAEHHLAEGNLTAARASIDAARDVAPRDPAISKLEARLIALEDGAPLPEAPAAKPKPGGDGAKAAERKAARIAARISARAAARAE
jgi:hypothetical protein